MTRLSASPDAAEMRAWIETHSNWGRWGDDDQLGAINLIGPERRRAAAAAVRTGVSVSLSRPLSTKPGPVNASPIEHEMRYFDQGEGRGGGAGERLALRVHGYDVTHIDALGHAWGNRGMWNRREPGPVLTPTGLGWASIDAWRDGIFTRGLLLDVARHRGGGHVGLERPVGGDELAAVLATTGCSPAPGDALVLHLGRDAFEAENPDWDPHTDPHPGLGASALEFLRDHDFAMLLWDLMDYRPYEIGWPLVPHAALFDLGVALVDNCSTTRLAVACANEARSDCMISVAPLLLPGGTGSPVNPLAVI